MDGLSAAASVLAVVQMAATLADGLIKLYDFWNTMREAPEDIADIVTDLKCLSTLMNEIANEDHHGLGILNAMECCEAKIKILMNIVREFEPNFSSQLGRVRFWYKFKAARKKQYLKQFRDSLQETKTTLLLALRPRCHLPPVYVDGANILKRNIATGSNPFGDQRPNISPLVRRISESELPLYSESEPKSFRSLSEPQIPLHTRYETAAIDAIDAKVFQSSPYPEAYQASWAASVPDVQASIQASIERALLSVNESAFDSNEFAKTINNTIQQASLVQSTACGPYAIEEVHAFEDEATNAAGQTIMSGDFSTVVSEDGSKMQHHISAMETLLGTVWLRTTTTKVNGRSLKSNAGHIVTSFVYYPSSWLTKFGLKNGLEISLSNSTRGWQFCLSPFRAVPDNSLVFDFCRDGNIPGVQRLIARGDASVQDTSSKGWTPLHFAAEAANVELCAYLISKGANKRAMVYEGPSDDALSPITIFGETAQSVNALRKVAMLKLFLDDLDTSEPSDEGWTVVRSLVKSQKKESSSLASNSITWLLQKYAAENTILFGPKTMWHGIQHAVRSLLHLSGEEIIGRKLEELGIYKLNSTIEKSHTLSIARWTAIQVTGRYLFPLLMIAGGVLHVDGFDWLGEGVKPDQAIVDKQAPFLFAAWTKTLRDCIERADYFLTLELEAAVEQAGWTQTILQRLNSKGVNLNYSEDILRCSTCNDDYTALKVGLVEPRWIAFAECVKIKHKFSCVCSEFPRSHVARRTNARQDHVWEPDQNSKSVDQPDESLPAESNIEDSQTTCSQKQKTPGGDGDISAQTSSNEDVDIEEVDDCNHWVGMEEIILETLDRENTNDPFKAAAHQFYRAQGRTWAGGYQPGEQVCGECLLTREGYTNEDENGDDDIYSSMPASFRNHFDR